MMNELLEEVIGAALESGLIWVVIVALIVLLFLWWNGDI